QRAALFRTSSRAAGDSACDASLLRAFSIMDRCWGSLPVPTIVHHMSASYSKRSVSFLVGFHRLSALSASQACEGTQPLAAARLYLETNSSCQRFATSFPATPAVSK